MERLPGLAPVGEGPGQGKSKAGRTATSRTASPRVGLTPSAQPVNTYVRPQQPVEDHRLGQLADALQNLNPAIGGYLKQSGERKEQEQLAQVKYYTEQFKKDRQEGAVSAAQVKKVFPELVPTVAARISESIAAGDAKEFAQGKVQGILEDRNIRLNTAARQEAISQIREEARQNAGDNPFYSSAYLSQLDQSLGEFETAWMRETAAYHEKVMTERFQDLAADALQSGGNLEELDSVWKQTGGLDNRQRKAAVVQAAVNLATSQMDPSILRKVPAKFLNAESKAQMADAHMAIQRAQHSMWSQERERAEYSRNMAIRQGQSAILERIANNEHVNPLEYRNIPELASFAERATSIPRVDPMQSKAAANTLENSLMLLGMTGEMDTAFPNDPYAKDFFDGRGVNRNSMVEYIADNPNMNPEERAQLLQKVDTISDGISLMQHPAVSENRGALTRRLNDLQSSIGQKLASVIEGQTLSADAERRYNRRIRTAVQEYLSEHQEMPPAWKMEEFAEAAYDDIDGWISNRVKDITGTGNLGGGSQPESQKPRANPSSSSGQVPSFEEWLRKNQSGEK